MRKHFTAMEEERQLTKREIQRAQKLEQSASKIEQYILNRMENWIGFRECLLSSKEQRILQMHEDLDGDYTDWKKILFMLNEDASCPPLVLAIYPPEPGSNKKHVITIELLEKDRPIDGEQLRFFGFFRQDMLAYGIKLKCRHKLIFDEAEGYLIELDVQAKTKMTYDELVEFLEKYNTMEII